MKDRWDTRYQAHPSTTDAFVTELRRRAKENAAAYDTHPHRQRLRTGALWCASVAVGTLALIGSFTVIGWT